MPFTLVHLVEAFWSR